MRWFVLLLLVACGSEPRFITVASTTSPENSGLYAVLLPAYEKATGMEVRALPVGTGRAIRIGRDGAADAVFVHNEALEKKFVADGHGVERVHVMSNEFVIVGPKSDPAGVAGTTDVAAALRTIAEKNATFVSRGDESGTHLREQAAWKESGVDPKPASGTWYLEAGLGMGATLNVAVGKRAYCLTDSSTWGAFGNKGDLDVLVRADPKLQNPYIIIVVKASKKRDDAQGFVDWLMSEPAQKIIREFEVNGERLFLPR